MEPRSEMNDFEAQLKRQTVRRLPSHWRARILAAAAQKHATENRSERRTSFWRELLWPCPQVWAGLAAAWIVVLCFNMASQGGPESSPSMAQRVPDSQPMQALAERQALLVELLDSPPSVQAPAPFVPRRRSDISQQTFAA